MRGVAFKVTYNDGGSRPDGLIGYRGVCSTPVILDNVKVRRMTNCCAADGPCRKFADNSFDGPRPSLNSHEPWCYESTLLSQESWRFGAGIFHRGPKKGEPIPSRQARVGDVAVLTTVKPNSHEHDRFIFAAFRIGRIFDDQHWGVCFDSDGTMNVRVPDEMVLLLKFWKYYSTKKGGHDWRCGLFRYLSEDQTERILAEMMGALGDRDQRDLIYEALDRRVYPRLPAGADGRQHLHGEGEGEAHRALKDRVASDPSLIGLPRSAKAEIEHRFLSGDRVDILFELPDGSATVVEIETIIPLPGAYQCVKYRALLEAERGAPLGSGNVRAVLVAYGFDNVTRPFASQYDIRLVQLSP